MTRPRRVHGRIPYYRSPEDADTIDPSWAALLNEYGLRMGDTICGHAVKHRVVARYRGEHVTCGPCQSLIASMIQRAFRVLAGLPTTGDRLWGLTTGPLDGE